MIITVTGGKGGTGKSTVASALSVELSKKYETLLVDVDVECPNDHLILPSKRKEEKVVEQPVPKFDFDKCTKCGACARACKQDAIVFAKNKFPAFVKEVCIGCMACEQACPEGAISVGRKPVGKIYSGGNHGVKLVSGELKLGELASGEVVSKVRSYADHVFEEEGFEVMVVDSAAGIGCPVIASIVGADFVVAVTEPTPSALHDLKRVLYLADHFGIKKGIVINKASLENSFYKKINGFAEDESIPVLAELPYSKDFVESTTKMKPVNVLHPKYSKTFEKIIRGVGLEY